MKRRVLVVSEFNAKERAHFAQSYEFCRVVTECDDADLIAPGINNYIERYLGGILPPHDMNVQRDLNRLFNGVRKGLGLKNAPTIEPVEVTQEYDLFFFVAWSPQSLVELSRIKNWRKRSKVAVVYLFELWASTVAEDRAYLKLLDQFDHVFLLHSAGIQQLQSYTRAPCSVLPVGVDCLIATPYPSPPERVVDVYSIGNRSAPVHRELMSLARHRNMFYLYDSLSSTDSHVKDWAEHRALLTNTIKRTRYFIGFSPATLAGSKAGKVAGEHVLPGRMFEGAAGGAIILGSAPQCAEFYDCFDWPNAVIEVSPDGSDIASVIDKLDSDPERSERLRQTNATGCLLKHDWVYRWEHILSVVEIAPLPQLQYRKAELSEVATTAMSLAPL